MPEYELRIKNKEQVMRAASYIARSAGVFFASPHELDVCGQKIIDFYNLGQLEEKAILFTMVQSADSPLVLKVSGRIINPELVREVQDAL